MNIYPVNQQYQKTFGWNYTTHLEMTMLALRDAGISNVDKRLVARYAQLPDFLKSELGFYNNAHFYYPHSKIKSYGRKANTENNGLFMFWKHTVNACQAKNKEDFLRETGYAIHFLQDAVTPQHTESGNIFEKMLKYKLHRDFEKDKIHGATARLPILIGNYEPEEIKFNWVKNLFHQIACFSAQKENKVTYFNKKEWPRIQQKCFNMGVNVTRAFAEYIIKTKEGLFESSHIV